MRVSIIVCALGWVSAVVLVWAWLLEFVEVGWLSIFAMVFFVLLGMGGGAFSLRR